MIAIIVLTCISIVLLVMADSFAGKITLLRRQMEVDRKWAGRRRATDYAWWQETLDRIQKKNKQEMLALQEDLAKVLTTDTVIDVQQIAVTVVLLAIRDVDTVTESKRYEYESMVARKKIIDHCVSNNLAMLTPISVEQRHAYSLDPAGLDHAVEFEFSCGVMDMLPEIGGHPVIFCGRRVRVGGEADAPRNIVADLTDWPKIQREGLDSIYFRVGR